FSLGRRFAARGFAPQSPGAFGSTSPAGGAVLVQRVRPGVPARDARASPQVAVPNRPTRGDGAGRSDRAQRDERLAPGGAAPLPRACLRQQSRYPLILQSPM